MVPEPRRSRGRLAESVAVVVVALSVVVVGLVGGIGGWIARIPEHTPTPAPITGPPAPTAVASREAARAQARESMRAQVAPALATRDGVDLLATLGLTTMAGQPAWAAIGAVDATTGEKITWTSPTFDPAQPAWTASTIKVVLAQAFWLHRIDAGEPVTDDDVEVLEAMLSLSSNPDADTVYDEIGGAEGLAAMLPRLGLAHSVANTDGYWGLTRTNVDDMLTALANLTSDASPLPPEARTMILAAMVDVATDQDWGVGEVAPGSRVKNGWLDLATLSDDDNEGGIPGAEEGTPAPDDADPAAVGVAESWLLGSVGIVTLPNGHLAHLVVLSQGWESQDEGIELVGELAANLVEALQR